MQIISVINYKGGVGKTTVTANLAGELAFREKKVLLLDMDAQASLTFSFVTPDYWKEKLEEEKTIKNWFDRITDGTDAGPLSDLVIRPSKVNTFLSQKGSSGVVDIVSSHLGLINVDLELAILLGGANMTQVKKNYIKVHGKLRTAIQDVVATNDYDVVLIDCPPNFNIVTKNALIASDKILIPAKPDYLSTLGIDYLCKNVRTLVSDFNEYALDSDTNEIKPNLLGVVFTMIQIYRGRPIAAQRQYIAQTRRLAERFEVLVMENNFRENKSIFADAPQNGMPVVLNAYSNNTHTDVVAEIKKFVDEFSGITGI